MGIEVDARSDRRHGPAAARGVPARRSRPTGRGRHRREDRGRLCRARPRTPTEWNWLALSRFVNVRYGLNTNDRELKKVGRDELLADLLPRAKEAIARFDFTPVDVLLDPQFGPKSVCGWLHQQLTLEMRPEEFTDLGSPDEAVELVRRKIDDLYRQKEIEFPVAVGMTNFMAEGPGGGGERYNRGGSRPLGQRAVPGRAAGRRRQKSSSQRNRRSAPRDEPKILRQRGSAPEGRRVPAQGGDASRERPRLPAEFARPLPDAQRTGPLGQRGLSPQSRCEGARAARRGGGQEPRAAGLRRTVSPGAGSDRSEP